MTFDLTRGIVKCNLLFSLKTVSLKQTEKELLLSLYGH